MLEHISKRIGSSAHMITTARVPADKPIRIAFSLNDSPDQHFELGTDGNQQPMQFAKDCHDDAPPENAFPLAFPDLEKQLQVTLALFNIQVFIVNYISSLPSIIYAYH
ncbi:MAP3K7 C-terminal-like protein [Varanus komodoensis]|nr:MAP3K7 C-terminal-like protein [Varanus komodoensis]